MTILVCMTKLVVRPIYCNMLNVITKSKLNLRVDNAFVALQLSCG